jgi:hypothetical protein
MAIAAYDDTELAPNLTFVLQLLPGVGRLLECCEWCLWQQWKTYTSSTATQQYRCVPL